MSLVDYCLRRKYGRKKKGEQKDFFPHFTQRFQIYLAEWSSLFSIPCLILFHDLVDLGLLKIDLSFSFLVL
jgi:hypothetical protein